MDRFAGRRIIVTGAGSGIGQATALRLIAEGGTVVAFDVNEEGLKATADQAADLQARSQQDSNQQGGVPQAAAPQASDRQAGGQQASDRQASTLQTSALQTSAEQASDRRVSTPQASGQRATAERGNARQAGAAQASAEQASGQQAGTPYAGGWQAGDRLSTAVLDISDEEAVRAGVQGAIEHLGGLDVLVNAAGILRSAHTHETSLDFWNTVLKVNLTGTFLMTREALPALLESGHGVVVNFSSTSASFAHPYMAAYAASKGGIQSFTHVLASEYAKQGLRAVSVAPGSISSGMTTGRGPGLPEDADMSLFGKLAPAIGQGFAGPETVAGVVAMLASDDGAFVTGTELRIDGGTHM